MSMRVAMIVMAMVIVPVRFSLAIGRELFDALVHNYLTLSKTISASNSGR